MIFYQLLRPVDYLLIRDESKWKIDFLTPLLVSMFCIVGFAFLAPRPQIFLKDGFLHQASELFAILPGFYLAALAAIATFSKSDLDNYMPAPTPQVETRSGGIKMLINLTRRRYLSLMFGYLTLLSLALFILILGANAAAQSLKELIGADYKDVVVLGFMFIFFFLSWHMVIVTMFGLYQLSDRMHQPDIKVNL